MILSCCIFFKQKLKRIFNNKIEYDRQRTESDAKSAAGEN